MRAAGKQLSDMRSLRKKFTRSLPDFQDPLNFPNILDLTDLLDLMDLADLNSIV